MAPKPRNRKGVASSSHGSKRLHTLGLGFVFNDLGECNLNMVWESLANWDPKERTNQVKLEGKLLSFRP
ncbi:hypothetical protein HAX54_032393 [Datura stramonium]|uniref:Uncharacterized protein n=1 Tax=Datura stramonium TaxID=4076 RepID=A0ABS8SCP6_DATST|nr:hypothetical protein [Datura stramonium]